MGILFKEIGLLVLFFCYTTLGQEIHQKICSRDDTSSACQQIARNFEVACNYNFHSVDCLLNIQSNKTHLGRITGEEALLGSNQLDENVVVLAEIRTRHPPSQTVVIVKNSIPDNFINLKGKKLCHPGYAHDSAVSHFMLQEFENKILETQNPECLSNVTLLERRLNTLSEFFNSTCRPGPWTQKEKSDQLLKEKYNSLCSLCGSEKCSVQYKSPFNDSVKCLIEHDADIAVTTLHEAQFFFNSSNINYRNYKYLCKNGSSSSFSEPCIWSSKLPDLLVAERKSASYMENYLRKNLKSYINSTKDGEDGIAKEQLVAILGLEFQKIVFLEEYPNYLSLKQYVEKQVDVPTPQESKQCDRTLKWCTYSLVETRKCEWLSQAAVNWGIQPVVECVRSEGDDELSCLDDIKKQRADIVVASSDYAYISLNKGLTSVAFPETDTRNLSVILAVKRANDTSIKSFNDLENKMACIPRFGGKEHLAFIDTTKNLKVTDSSDNCDYGEVLSDFIGSSCVPGVRSQLIQEITTNVDKDKLCAQCSGTDVTLTPNYCNDDDKNKYFGNEGALRCLRDQKADFAIITIVHNETIASDLQVICKNNQLSSGTGLTNDGNCALAVLPNSEVVASIDNSKIQDIKFALYEFEKWFGQNLKKPFHLFDTFSGQPDLLFLDSTPGLNIDSEVEYIQEYKKLLTKVKQCNNNYNSATSIYISFVILVSIFIIHIHNLF